MRSYLSNRKQYVEINRTKKNSFEQVSSNINDVIKTVLNFLFFYEKILHAPKAQKTQKHNQRKAQKRK